MEMTDAMIATKVDCIIGLVSAPRRAPTLGDKL